MDELIGEFISETNENLEALDVYLVNLEKNPNDRDLLSKIFRLMHTIKGTCGFLSLPRLEKLAHHAENVLGCFRDGDLDVTPSTVTLIFESIDSVRYILGAIEKNGVEPDGDDSAIILRLDAMYEGFDVHSTAIELTPERVSTRSAAMTIAPQSLRVNVEVLEGLMTMVTELASTRDELMQVAQRQKDSDFAAPLQRLNHIVSGLQDGVMKTRMQPIGKAWAKLPRIVRDMSLGLGKKVELEMKGQDTELDRQVLEMIKAPLTHMVRNSADHGIEKPAERAAVGKQLTGRIVLDAYHEGDHIVIEISDDGKGLSMQKIIDKAVASGLVIAAEVKDLTTQQIQQFIFNAGFSTAEKVTAVSGRGVGMDVVRTNIEKIGGSIELTSVEGKGATFVVKIPMRLAGCLDVNS